MESTPELEEILRECRSTSQSIRASLRRSSEEILTEDSPDPARLSDLGDALLRHYDFTSAAKVFGHLLSLPVSDTAPLLGAARSLLSTGCHAEAVHFLSQTLARHPGEVSLMTELGIAHEKEGRSDIARDLAKHALLGDPTYAPAVRLLARIERRSGDGHTARIRLIQRLQQPSAGHEWPLHHELANVFDDLDEPQAAIREIGKAKAGAHAETKVSLAQSREHRSRQWDVTSRINQTVWSKWAAGSQALQSVVFVGGFPCSGTLELGSILKHHPQCQVMMESGIVSSQFSRPLIQQNDAAGEAFTTLDRQTDEDMAGFRSHYLQCAGAVTGSPIEGRLLLDIDSSFPADLPVPLRMFPTAKVLMLVRDPRDAILDYYFNHQPTSEKEAPSLDLREACRFYAETMWHWLHLAPTLSHSARVVRQEDLLRDATGTMRELCNFLGIGRSLHQSEDPPIVPRRIRRWHSYESWLAPHLHHLEPFIETFGYKS